MITRCHTCDKPIALKKTAWTCGPMFCSHDCGVKWAKTKYAHWEYSDDNDLTSKATRYFKDIAEEISREDYGARTEYTPVYSLEYDITTVYEQVYEGDDLICMSVVNWYYGKDGDNTPGNLTAVFVD